MKNIKWKILLITCLVCLLPVFSGLILWDKLPETMAVHFDINNNPDNFASKTFVVLGLPFCMMAVQLFLCIVNDFNQKKHKGSGKAEKLSKWIIPFVNALLHFATIGYGMGYSVDVRRVASFIVSVVFILTGSLVSGMDYIKNYNIDKEKAKKINKTMGITMICLGVLFFISMFLPSVATVVCLLLMIPYLLFSVIYTIIVANKK